MAKRDTTKIILTAEQLDYLRSSYATTMNSMLCDVLHISHTSLHRFARQYGLTKEHGFLETNRKRISEMAVDAKRRNGTLHLMPVNAGNANWRKYTIKPGECLLKRLPKERQVAAHAKAVKTRKQRRAYKLKRMLYGLEVTGNERIRMESKAYIVRESSVRSRMRRYGYEIERAGMVAYYSDQTRRIDSLEKAASGFGIEVVCLL